MPRCARIKTKNSIYHIIVRSISEVMLFKERNDKAEYISIIKKYQNLFGFKIYAYCLMDNHAHFIIYSNGTDISKIMHNVNFSYAQKFNCKYNRHGHLFQDRFKSKIVNNEKYLLALTAYIHNNPRDMEEYKNSPENYEFSSMSSFLDGKRDENNILDLIYVNGLLNKNKFRNKRIYRDLLRYEIKSGNAIEYEFQSDKFLYNSGKKSKFGDLKLEELITHIAFLINTDPLILKLKYNRKLTKKRIITILLLRNIFDRSCKEICKAFGNISIGRISMLTRQGIKLIDEDTFFRSNLNKYIKLLSF